MTQLDVLYRYGTPPTENASIAIGNLREIYGIRKLHLDERARTIRIEYDASRLTEPVIHQLLRRAGLDIVEAMPMFAPPAPASEPAPAS